jgi:septal ring factor EnvC (AmiA/AmiB activator)
MAVEEPDVAPEAFQPDRKLLNRVFQSVAHLTSSLAQLEKRLEKLDHTINRTQDRLTDFQTKLQKRKLGIDSQEGDE